MQQLAFLQQAGVSQLVGTYDLLPDVLFWIKDRDSRIMYANQAYVENLGLKTLQQVLGQSDMAFSPAHIARQFIVDDQKVMAGELVTDRLELNVLHGDQVAWFSTSKRPLFDPDGEIIGSYGITRHLERTSRLFSDIEAIQTPVQYVRDHFQQPIAIETLAQMTHLSVSALERRFKKYLAKSPKQFINQVRLEHARRLLIETALPISDVAYQSGFAEHSYFSKQFKRLFGSLPSQLRAQMANEKG